MLFTQEQIDLWQGQVAVALTKPKFRQWVERQPYRETLGERMDCKECIIARYLREVLPHLDCEVGLHHIFCNIPSHIVVEQGGSYDDYRIYYMGHPSGRAPEIPQWVKTFVERIDANRSLPQITRQDALDALNFV